MTEERKPGYKQTKQNVFPINKSVIGRGGRVVSIVALQSSKTAILHYLRFITRSGHKTIIW